MQNTFKYEWQTNTEKVYYFGDPSYLLGDRNERNYRNSNFREGRYDFISSRDVRYLAAIHDVTDNMSFMTGIYQNNEEIFVDAATARLGVFPLEVCDPEALRENARWCLELVGKKVVFEYTGGTNPHFKITVDDSVYMSAKVYADNLDGINKYTEVKEAIFTGSHSYLVGPPNALLPSGIAAELLTFADGQTGIYYWNEFEIFLFNPKHILIPSKIFTLGTQAKQNSDIEEVTAKTIEVSYRNTEPIVRIVERI